MRMPANHKRQNIARSSAQIKSSCDGGGDAAGLKVRRGACVVLVAATTYLAAGAPVAMHWNLLMIQVVLVAAPVACSK
jgi:hypothetical protein